MRMSMSPKRSEVRVFAPATVANLSCGYDVLGLAIDGPGDEVILRHVEGGAHEGLVIKVITGDEGILPLAVEKNTAGVAALSVLKEFGVLNLPLEMEIHKKMPCLLYTSPSPRDA